MEHSVIFEVKDEIAFITLNRPERRNAINKDLLVNLYNFIDEVSMSSNIKVAVITGNGKSFCSGLDLAVVGKENLFNPRGDNYDLPDVFKNCEKPIIGAVNGHAITGGFEIALNCDFLIASENASFADTHIKVGIHPGWGMTQLLQQAIGQRRAKQMSFTCQFISAKKALEYGLVNEVVAGDQLLERAAEIANQICANVSANDKGMLKTFKKLVEYRNNASFEDAFAHERDGFKQFVEEKM